MAHLYVLKGKKRNRKHSRLLWTFQLTCDHQTSNSVLKHSREVGQKEMVINSVNEERYIMTGPRTWWWGWWMALHSNKWQFITHFRHRHTDTHSFKHIISHSLVLPLILSLINLLHIHLGITMLLFSVVLLAVELHIQPWKTHMQSITPRCPITYPH